MIKIISIIFSLSLGVTLAVSVLAAPDLNGSWSGFGYSFKASQSGNSITLTATDGDISGKVALAGTITGNALEGRQILVAKGCPNLEKYVPAKGTISSDGNSITVTYKNSDYDPSRCVDLPGNESEETGSYTRASSPPASTTLPQSTQVEQQGKQITCEQIWKIVGSEECDKWVISNDEGGVWCNLPERRESLQPWIYGPDPTYTFIPGTCPIESKSESGGESGTSVSKPQQRKSSQDSNPFNIFGINPFETWLNLKGLASVPQALDYLVRETEFLSEPREIKIDIPEPSISTDDEGKAWDFLKDYVPQEGSVSPFKKPATVKLPGENKTETFDVDEDMPPGSVIQLADPAQFVDTGGHLLLTQALGGQGTLTVPQYGDGIYYLEDGQVEVTKQPDSFKPFSIKTPNALVTDSRTHFIVRHDKKENKTLVAVYEGEVEVKTNDGKIQIVSPDGDKPGVVIVSQKLSPVKLAIGGVVLMAVLGGIILFLKRKFAPKGLTKKKK